MSRLQFQGTSLKLSCLVPEPLFGSSQCEDDCTSGWELNGVPVGEDLIHHTNPSGFMTTNELAISYLKHDVHKGNYQCYSKHCVDGECKKVLSQMIVNVDVVMKPPQIKVDDRKTKTINTPNACLSWLFFRTIGPLHTMQLSNEKMFWYPCTKFTQYLKHSSQVCPVAFPIQASTFAHLISDHQASLQRPYKFLNGWSQLL